MRSMSKAWSAGVFVLSSSLSASCALADAEGPAATAVTNDASEDVIDAIVVTGTHVRTADETPVVNVQIIDRAQLEQSGAAQVSDLIKRVPANTGTTLYNESGPLSGTAQFSLRGLGFSSTLTLLNGRRAGISPLSDRTGADFVDINQFPLAMIERVDVLKDGSSAIYGSEAVAGVVNLVTRKGFEGMEMSLDYSSSSNESYSANLASGQRFDRGSVNLYATYYEQTGNVRSDFSWLKKRIGGNGVPGRSQLLSTNGYPASYQRAALNSSGTAAPVPNAVLVADPGCEAAGGVFAINDAGAIDRRSCRFNFMDQVGVIPAQQRIQSFFEADYDITDSLTYFNETSASRNVNKIEAQVGGFSNGSAAAGAIYVPANHPFNFFTADPNNPANLIYVAPENWNNAVHAAVPVVASFRPEGQYVSKDKRQTNTYLRTVNGLDFAIGAQWQATLSHQYAHAEFEENVPLSHNATSINNLLSSGTYNPFASSRLTPGLVSPKDGVSVAGNSQATLDRLFYTSNVQRRSEQQVADLSASGPIVDLPAGPVSVAVGGQYRTQTLTYVPDSLAAQGLSSSPTQESPFSGRQNVWAGYLETIVPLHETLHVQAAVRYEDYGSGPGSTTDPKITARWEMLPGMLGLHASWGTSFQAPTLAQGATAKTLVLVNDPVRLGAGGYSCSRGTIGSGANVITSGDDLEPQDSTNYTVGFDLRPIAKLDLTADYWHYDYSNLIAPGQNAQSIVNGECRNGVYRPDPRVQRTAAGLVNTINTPFVNVGKVVTDGFDLGASYAVSLNQLGDLSFQTNTTYVHEFDAYGADGAVTHAAGSRNFNSNFAPMPKWRGTAQLNWSMDIHDVSLGINHTDSYRNDQSNDAPIGSFTTVDVQYALKLNAVFGSDDATTLTVGVNNAFDKDPPALIRYNANGQLISGTVSDIDRPGYDPLAGADIRGRTYYVRLKQTF